MKHKLKLCGACLLLTVLFASAMTNPFASQRVAASRPGVKFGNLQVHGSITDPNSHAHLECDEGSPFCAEVSDSIGYNGGYTGHDEPSLLFYSNSPGAGNSSRYLLRLPKESKTLPKQDGTGGTWNFQLHPAFWFGMALCDNQSAPEFTHAPCVPDSDTNIFDGSNPSAANYIGKHPGTAFLELQFYPPGWVPWFDAISCDPTKWCAAMAIFSLNNNYNTGIPNNEDCLDTVGIEPANFAFVTLNGEPHGPPGPLDQTVATFTPNPTTDLFMNAGDLLKVVIRDEKAGLQTIIIDKTTGQQGSMTASVANGFAQINFEPNAAHCSQTPYAFHPMYATSSEHTRVPWAAHSYNVAFSDEIGHFEYCSRINATTGQCKSSVNDPGGPDEDDFGCFPPSASYLVQIGGCIATDNDFDGVSYQKVWPGTLEDAKQDANLHPQAIQFSSPRFKSRPVPGAGLADVGDNYLKEYSRVAFEADLPRIQAADFGGNCNRTTGANCQNPPPGANFYPIYTTQVKNGRCMWQLGGTNIPNTTQTFGGNSTAEYGPLLNSVYPGAGFTPVFRFNNFRQVLVNNPCPNP